MQKYYKTIVTSKLKQKIYYKLFLNKNLDQ